jgi:hypothetical protein
MNTFISKLPARRARRTHSAEFKAGVVRACRQPGMSMAAVALANGINANLLRKWVIDTERQDMSGAESGPATRSLDTESLPDDPPSASGFVALHLAPPAPAPVTPQDIRVEVHRAGMTITVSWPINAASDCAAWMREILR